MEIPLKIREALKQETTKYKGHIQYLGVYKGKTAWRFYYSEPVCVGPPSLYLFDGSNVEYLCGEDIFDIILQLEKS
jgi:hypothetical protein